MSIHNQTLSDESRNSLIESILKVANLPERKRNKSNANTFEDVINTLASILISSVSEFNEEEKKKLTFNLLKIQTFLSGETCTDLYSTTKKVNAAVKALGIVVETDDEVVEIINHLVDEYLFPYLAGQITTETEDTNRKPLMTVLMDTLAMSSSSMEDEKVMELAVKQYAYVASSAYNLFTTSDELREAFPRSIFPKNPKQEHAIAPFLSEFQRAIAFDFPGSYTEDEVRQIALQALQKHYDKHLEDRKKKS